MSFIGINVSKSFTIYTIRGGAIFLGVAPLNLEISGNISFKCLITSAEDSSLLTPWIRIEWRLIVDSDTAN